MRSVPPGILSMAHLWKVHKRHDSNLALLKVDFGSRGQSRVPDFYSTFVKKSTLMSTLLDFKSGKSNLDSTRPRGSIPYPKP